MSWLSNGCWTAELQPLPLVIAPDSPYFNPLTPWLITPASSLYQELVNLMMDLPGDPRNAACEPHCFCAYCPPSPAELRWKTRTADEQRRALRFHPRFSSLSIVVQAGGCHLCCLLFHELKATLSESDWQIVEAQDVPLTLEAVSFDRAVLEKIDEGGYGVEMEQGFHHRPQCRLAITAFHPDGSPLCHAELILYRTSYLPWEPKFPAPDDDWDRLGINNPSKAQASLSTGSDLSIELARRWLSSCMKSHLKCKPYDGYPLPTRLLDVSPSTSAGKIRLALSSDLPPNTRYITLSYCWGRGKPVVLEQRTLADFQREIDPSSLPKTISDAADITRRLGYKYLWVDSLCIIQDSKQDWAAEAARMGDIYFHSTLTIAATASASNHGGCYKTRNPLSYLPCRLDGKPSGGLYATRKSQQRDIISVQRRFVQEAPLNQRAWVVQERLLSQRILHFTANGLFWECSALEAYDSCPEGRPVRESRFVHENIRFHLRGLLRPPVARAESSTSGFFARAWQKALVSVATVSPRGWEETFHEDWQRLVSLYTRSQMTVPTDKKPALAGIVSQIEKARRELTFAEGLWYRDALHPHQLLWAVKGDVRERPAYRGAPSWSWLSVDGEICPAVGGLPKGFKGDWSPDDDPASGQWGACSGIVGLRIATAISTGDGVSPSVITVKGRLLSIQPSDLGCLRFRPDCTDVGPRNDESLYVLPLAYRISPYARLVLYDHDEQELGKRQIYMRGFAGLVLVQRESGGYARIGTFETDVPRAPEQREATREEEGLEAKVAAVNLPERMYHESEVEVQLW